jgi:hypothetical protein
MAPWLRPTEPPLMQFSATLSVQAREVTMKLPKWVFGLSLTNSIPTLGTRLPVTVVVG